MILANPDKFAVIEHHVYDQWATPETQARMDYYAAISAFTPAFVFDGLLDAWPISDYETNFAARQVVETDVTIQIGGEHLSGHRYGISARVSIEPDGRTKEMAIHFVQVLDHWPSDAWYFRNTYKQAAEPQLVFLYPGETATVDVEFDLDADSVAQLADVKIIAWAQANKSSGPAEVHQAAKLYWPFTPLDGICGDLDEDGSVGLFDYWLFLDAFGTTAGDPRFLPAADLNEDDLVSWLDYAIWVRCYRDANGREFAPDDPGDGNEDSWQPAPDAEPAQGLRPAASPSSAEQNNQPRSAVRRSGR